MKDCAVCHGADGTGNGPAASRLRVAPPDLTRIDAREDGAFPWAHVMSQIDGFTRRNRPDQVMHEFGATMDSPTVLVDTGDGILTPTPEPLVDLAV